MVALHFAPEGHIYGYAQATRNGEFNQERLAYSLFFSAASARG